MNRSARTCFLAMMLGEAFVLASLLLVGRLGYAVSGRAVGRNQDFSDGEQLTVALLILGVLLIWSGLWAFPKSAWPHGRGVRSGLLVGLVPVVPLCALLAEDLPAWLRQPMSVALLPGSVLVLWLIAHPLLLANEARRKGEVALFATWSVVALLPLLAIALWGSAPALAWSALLAVLAMRLALGSLTAFAWRATSPTNVRIQPPFMVTTGLRSPRARICWLSMLIMEATLIGFLALDPWMDMVETERYIADLHGRPIAPNVFFDFVEPLGWLPLIVGVLLLGIAIGALPKHAWPHGKIVRTGLLAAFWILFALMSTETLWDTDGGVIYTLCGWTSVISLFILLAWLMIHPLQLAREAKRRAQSLMSIGWAIVGLATPVVLFLSLFEVGDAITLTLSLAVVSLAVRLGLGAAMAITSSPSLGATS